MTWRTLLLAASLVGLVLWLLVYLLAVTTWRALDEGAPPDPRMVASSAGRAFIADMEGLPTTTTVAPTTTTHTHPPRARTAPTVRVSRPAPSGDVFYALAMCETGGTMNQRATSRTGRYLGFFQFSLATWRSVGGPGDPRDHSYEVQKSYAVALQARSGWGQWPHCSRKLGLR